VVGRVAAAPQDRQEELAEAVALVVLVRLDH
jgi:hypothetical protein